jgi:hypothetical protein
MPSWGIFFVCYIVLWELGRLRAAKIIRLGPQNPKTIGTIEHPCKINDMTRNNTLNIRLF